MLIKKDDFFLKNCHWGHDPPPLPPLYVHRSTQIRYFHC